MVVGEEETEILGPQTLFKILLSKAHHRLVASAVGKAEKKETEES